MIIKQLRYCKRYYFSFWFKNFFVFFYRRDKVEFPYTGSYNFALRGLHTFSFWKWYCLDIAQRYVKVNLTHIKGFVRFNFQVCRVLLELRLVLWFQLNFTTMPFKQKNKIYCNTRLPSVAKAMRCPMGDISMEVTHWVSAAVRTTWKETYIRMWKSWPLTAKQVWKLKAAIRIGTPQPQ